MSRDKSLSILLQWHRAMGMSDTVESWERIHPTLKDKSICCAQKKAQSSYNSQLTFLYFYKYCSLSYIWLHVDLYNSRLFGQDWRLETIILTFTNCSRNLEDEVNICYLIGKDLQRQEGLASSRNSRETKVSGIEWVEVIGVWKWRWDQRGKGKWNGQGSLVGNWKKFVFLHQLHWGILTKKN